MQKITKINIKEFHGAKITRDHTWRTPGSSGCVPPARASPGLCSSWRGSWCVSYRLTGMTGLNSYRITPTAPGPATASQTDPSRLKSNHPFYSPWSANSLKHVRTSKIIVMLFLNATFTTPGLQSSTANGEPQILKLAKTTNRKFLEATPMTNEHENTQTGFIQ